MKTHLLLAAAIAVLSDPATASPRVVERVAKDTLTPVELDGGDELHFKLRGGELRTLKLVKTTARVVEGTAANVKKYAFTAFFELDGSELTIERVVPAQESFYEPVVIRGMRIWLDAVSDIFRPDGGFLDEKDAGIGIVCQPKRKARLAVNDVRDRICPETLAWWYPERGDRFDVRNCYRGEDVWMGPYDGRLAHGGLDLNMKSGTPLFAPIDFDDQFLFNSLAAGNNNNRWRGIRRWPNGSTWWLQAHHLNKMLVPEHTPLAHGARYAETAGVLTGAHEHSHFAWRISEEGEDYWLDPWIFFWQTFQDQKPPAALAAAEENPWRTLPLIADGKVAGAWKQIGWGGFAVEDGALRTEPDDRGMGLLLYTAEKFGDCQLRVIYRCEKPKSNAGVYVRLDDGVLAKVGEKSPEVHRNEKGKLPPEMIDRLKEASEKSLGAWYPVHHGYEVQIMDAADPFHRTGAIYSLAKAEPVPSKPQTEWRTMLVTLAGERITIEVDGKRLSQFDATAADLPARKQWTEPMRENQRPTHGYLGLQNHDPGDSVWFREVSVRALPSP